MPTAKKTVTNKKSLGLRFLAAAAACLVILAYFHFNRKIIRVPIIPTKSASDQNYMSFSFDTGGEEPCSMNMMGKRCLCYSLVGFSNRMKVSHVNDCESEANDCGNRIQGMCLPSGFIATSNRKAALPPLLKKFKEIPVGSEAEITLEESGIERLNQIYFKGAPVLKVRK
jgi:hypothetical protein